MSNYDRAFGFQPYGEVLRARWYAVKTGCDIGYYHGDMVGLLADHLATPRGYLPGLFHDSNIDGLDNLVGAILALEDEDGFPVLYIATEEAGNSVIAGMALVADDPEQQYVAREDYSTNAIDILADASLNADLVSQTLTLGNNATGRSTQMIQSSSINAAVDRQLKMFGPHPMDTDLIGENSPGVSGEEGCRWICKVTQHYHAMTGVTGGVSA